MRAKLTIKPQASSDGLHSLMIRITHKGSRQWKKTNIMLSPSEWDETAQGLRVIPACPAKSKSYPAYQRYKEIRDFILDKERIYNDKIDQLTSTGKPFTIQRVFDEVENPPQAEITVYGLFEIRIQELHDDHKHGNARTYADTLSMIKQFTDQKDLMFFEMDASWLIKFRRYLSQTRAQGNGTIFKHLRGIRAIYNLAIKRKISTLNDYPFKNNPEIMAGLKVAFNSQPLTKMEIDQIRHLGEDQIPVGSDLWHARNYFIFMYVGHGHNFADLIRMRWSDIRQNRIHYVRYKTRSKVPQMGSFVITHELSLILAWYRKHWASLKQIDNPYIFPILTGFHRTERQKINRSHRVLKEVNRSLQQIQAMIGTSTKITTYTARHSMANQLVKAGESPVKIQQILRHQSIETTQHYLKQFDNDAIDQAVASL